VIGKTCLDEYSNIMERLQGDSSSQQKAIWKNYSRRRLQNKEDRPDEPNIEYRRKTKTEQLKQLRKPTKQEET
jgi:hypothetical protein